MEIKLTAANLASFISKLKNNVQYPYINNRTGTVVLIHEIQLTEGPISIKRYNPQKSGALAQKPQTISPEMLWRVANAIRPNIPFNLDRILGASYNTRSALETLLAHTPQFYYCYPGRIERLNDIERICKGHKHLIWCPDKPHSAGVIEKLDVDIVISEAPNNDVVYDSVAVTEFDTALDINVVRRHAQIQIALYMIGSQLGYRTWIAQNDKGIQYKNRRLCEYEGVISDLRNERLLAAFGEAARAALLIDCIWFKNGKLMPAVMEIEHTTGVRSGLLRMKKFQDYLPPFPSRWVIVAPDADRKLVFKECQAPQFQTLAPKYFSYSAVEELYDLCTRRKISGVTEDFLDCFMETTV